MKTLVLLLALLGAADAPQSAYKTPADMEAKVVSAIESNDEAKIAGYQGEIIENLYRVPDSRISLAAQASENPLTARCIDAVSALTMPYGASKIPFAEALKVIYDAGDKGIVIEQINSHGLVANQLAVANFVGDNRIIEALPAIERSLPAQIENGFSGGMSTTALHAQVARKLWETYVIFTENTSLNSNVIPPIDQVLAILKGDELQNTSAPTSTVDSPNTPKPAASAKPANHLPIAQAESSSHTTPALIALGVVVVAVFFFRRRK